MCVDATEPDGPVCCLDLSGQLWIEAYEHSMSSDIRLSAKHSSTIVPHEFGPDSYTFHRQMAVARRLEACMVVKRLEHFFLSSWNPITSHAPPTGS